MSVITISRQLGSLGNEVARLTAEQLGYRLVGRDLINQAARKAGAPEAALAAIDELGLLGLRPPHAVCDAYHAAVRQVMLELSEAGDVVIVGRGGQSILRGRPGTYHVRIIAPVTVRIERIARRKDITLECAKAQVETSDKFHFNYLKRCYGIRWDDQDLYDLILNTHHLPVNQAAALICQVLA